MKRWQKWALAMLIVDAITILCSEIRGFPIAVCYVMALVGFFIFTVAWVLHIEHEHHEKAKRYLR